MKKTLAIILASVALISCSKEILDKTTEENVTPVAEIVFNLSANHPDDAATKAVKTGWETDDVIFVFFSRQAAPEYLEMKWSGTAWVSTPKNSLALAENETGTMRAVYLPFGSGAGVAADGTAFKFDTQYNTYYLTATLPYTVTGGTVSGTFNMQIPDGYVQFFLNDADASSSTEIELREPHLTPQGIASIAADGTITHTAIASGAPLKGYVYDKEAKADGESKGYLFSGILAAGARNSSTDYHFTLVSGGWQGTYYQKAFSGKTWYRGATEGRALKMPALSSWTTVTDYKPIDLGTDVGGKRIYWASCNVGANKPEDYGDYFAWGETSGYDSGKTNFSWATYKWMQSGQSDWKHITKYTFADGQTSGIWYDGSIFIGDNKTVLDFEDDAARVNWGGSWRMPTNAEMEALLGLSGVWVTDYEGSGVNGYRFTGSNGNTLFLPAASYYWDTNLNDLGTEGNYWSSSLNESFSDIALSVFFDSPQGAFSCDSNGRSDGLSVRPVTE